MIAIKAAKKERQAKLTEWLHNLKESSPCSDCKVYYPYYVMQFDHVRDAKEINISMAINRDWTQNRIQQELDKCELVCANCHAKRTHMRRQSLLEELDSSSLSGDTWG